MTKREVVEKFYDSHPDAQTRIMTWFDIWEHIHTIVKEWDDDCIEVEYDELCRWMNGEEYLLKSLEDI